MPGITQALMVKALDGLTARAMITADNIANAGSPGFRPRQVMFERALAAAATRGEAAVAAVRPEVRLDSGAGPDVRLDLELATASATALRYAAIMDLLGRQIRLDSLAVTGGR